MFPSYTGSNPPWKHWAVASGPSGQFYPQSFHVRHHIGLPTAFVYELHSESFEELCKVSDSLNQSTFLNRKYSMVAYLIHNFSQQPPTYILPETFSPAISESHFLLLHFLRPFIIPATVKL